jgi:hypothetical protein
MFIIIAVTDSTASVIRITKNGDIIGASSYGTHYFAEKMPIGRARGLENLELIVEPI